MRVSYCARSGLLLERFIKELQGIDQKVAVSKRSSGASAQVKSGHQAGFSQVGNVTSLWVLRGGVNPMLLQSASRRAGTPVRQRMGRAHSRGGYGKGWAGNTNACGRSAQLGPQGRGQRSYIFYNKGLEGHNTPRDRTGDR